MVVHVGGQIQSRSFNQCFYYLNQMLSNHMASGRVFLSSKCIKAKNSSVDGREESPLSNAEQMKLLLKSFIELLVIKFDIKQVNMGQYSHGKDTT